MNLLQGLDSLLTPRLSTLQTKIHCSFPLSCQLTLPRQWLICSSVQYIAISLMTASYAWKNTKHMHKYAM